MMTALNKVRGLKHLWLSDNAELDLYDGKFNTWPVENSKFYLLNFINKSRRSLYFHLFFLDIEIIVISLETFEYLTKILKVGYLCLGGVTLLLYAMWYLPFFPQMMILT